MTEKKKKRGRGRPKTTGTTPVVQFRLSEDVREKLDAIADYHFRASGIEMTRAGAVRVAVHTEFLRTNELREQAEANQ